MMPLSFRRMVATVLLLCPSAALADRRSFARTYEYMTMPAGDLELEFYNTQTMEKFDDEAPQAFQMQIEVEYGITDHWDVSLYQVFSQAGAEPLHYSATKLRSRYRFAERGLWPVDTLLYFEAVKAFGGLAGSELEAKLILARDFGPVTLAVNPIVELEVEEEMEAGGEAEKELELEAGFAAGLTYEVAPSFRVGAESFSKGKRFWAGPSISWAPSPKFWTTVNAGFGLNEKADDFTVQAILGLGI